MGNHFVGSGPAFIAVDKRILGGCFALVRRWIYQLLGDVRICIFSSGRVLDVVYDSVFPEDSVPVIRLGAYFFLYGDWIVLGHLAL